MTPEHIEKVKTSWAKVVPIADDAAALFYGKLFELDPAVKAYFKGDMKEQGKKLMTTISLAVNSLDHLEELLPVVAGLGRRHVNYSVKDQDYDTVGEALLWTLGQGLGDTFDDAHKAAWTETYTTLANVMKKAAAEE